MCLMIAAKGMQKEEHMLRQLTFKRKIENKLCYAFYIHTSHTKCAVPM